LQTLLYDGWVIRLAKGYTRRANSVYPLYVSTLDPHEKIAASEGLYEQAGQRAVFKLTEAALPPALDEILAERGYQREAPTSVQTLALAGPKLPASGQTTMAEAVTEDWLADYCRLNAIDERHRPAMRAMLGNIQPAHAFASLREGGDVVACGLVVVDQGYAGLHDIVTHPAHRNRGHGRQLVIDLLAWARARGAQAGWLGVMLDNDPAVRLYRRAGFQEQYRYWYRVQSPAFV
jgi:ribosomal protein S18 acetylase RimI-like enzyme